MSELENRLPDTSELGQLKEQCAELRRLATFLLLGLVVLSFTFAFFCVAQRRTSNRVHDQFV